MYFQIYADRAGEWRWRAKADNNVTIADSGEGYANKADCLNGIDIIKLGAATAEVVEL